MPPQKTLNEFFQEKYGIPVPAKPTKDTKPNPDIFKLTEPKKLTRKEKSDEKKFVNIMLYGIMAPTVWPNDWSKTYPQEIRDKAKMYRMAELPKIMETEQSTDFDAMLYVSCASLNAPPNREAYSIAMYCIDKYYDLKMIADSTRDDLQWLKHDADLSQNEPARILLANLKRYIYKTQMSYVNSHA